MCRNKLIVLLHAIVENTIVIQKIQSRFGTKMIVKEINKQLIYLEICYHCIIVAYSSAPVWWSFLIPKWWRNQADECFIGSNCWCKIPIIVQSMIECFIDNFSPFIWIRFNIFDFVSSFGIFDFIYYILKAFNCFDFAFD